MNLMSQITLSVPIYPLADVMFHFTKYESFIWNSKAKFDFLKLEPPKNVNKIIRIPESRNSVEMISTLGSA